MYTVLAVLAAYQVFDADPREIQLMATWKAICWKESRGDPRAFKKDENAAGIGQIRPIYLADANRILGWEAFRPEDRFDPGKSYAMFHVVVCHYKPRGTPAEWARIHNGGPRGWRKASTLPYAAEVLQIMAEQR